MFGAYENSGLTAFKTSEIVTKYIPKWYCPKCGEGHIEQDLECNVCSFTRPDKHTLIANRMLMDKEEKLAELMDNPHYEMKPEMFNRYLLGIKKFAEKHDLMDMLRDSTRGAIKSLPEDAKL